MYMILKIVKNIKSIIVNSIYSISIIATASTSTIKSMSIIINMSIIIALTLTHARTPLAPHLLNNHYHHLLLRRLREDTRATIGAKIGVGIT